MALTKATNTEGVVVSCPEETRSTEMPVRYPLHSDPTGDFTLSNDSLDESVPVGFPSITISELFCSPAASSAALPQGQISELVISSEGRWILTVGASLIHIIDARSLPYNVAGAFRFRRRPIATDIHDEGSILAVLSDAYSINVYRIVREGNVRLEHSRKIHLSLASRKIVICPDGLVLAALREDRRGMEFISLAAGSHENDRRSVRCETFDYGMFSSDSRTFLGSTYDTSCSASVMISVHPLDGPIDEEGVPLSEKSDRAWTRRLLFPQKIDDTHHACLMPRAANGMAEWMVAAVSGDDHLSVIDIAMQPMATRLLLGFEPLRHESIALCHTPPAVSPCGQYVAVATSQKDWVQILLYDLSHAHDEKHRETRPHTRSTLDVCELLPCLVIPVLGGDGVNRPRLADLKWQSLSEGTGSTRVRYRLVAVNHVSQISANQETYDANLLLESIAPCGHIFSIEFGDAASDGLRTLKVDLDNSGPQHILLDEELDLEVEIQLARRRTVAQRRQQEAKTGPRFRRAATSQSHAAAQSSRPQPDSQASREPESIRAEDIQAALEVPYAHAQPRSGLSLQRAATIAAVSPANRTRLSAAPSVPLEYRRADGRQNAPHESDADDWIPPPPPYTPKSDSPIVPAGVPVALAIPHTPAVPPAVEPTLACTSTSASSAFQGPSSHVDPSSPSHARLPSDQMAAPSQQITLRATDATAFRRHRVAITPPSSRSLHHHNPAATASPPILAVTPSLPVTNVSDSQIWRRPSALSAHANAASDVPARGPNPFTNDTLSRIGGIRESPSTPSGVAKPHAVNRRFKQRFDSMCTVM